MPTSRLLPTLLTLTLLALPATAGAATVRIDVVDPPDNPKAPGSDPPTATVVFAAVPGETNVVTVGEAAGAIVVTEAGAALTAGSGCMPQAPGTVVCPDARTAARSFGGIAVHLGDGDDRLSASAGVRMRGYGGAGADVLEGGGMLLGEDGDDTVTVGPDADQLGGGAGRDRIDGGAGDDVLEGGLRLAVPADCEWISLGGFRTDPALQAARNPVRWRDSGVAFRLFCPPQALATCEARLVLRTRRGTLLASTARKLRVRRGRTATATLRATRGGRRLLDGRRLAVTVSEREGEESWRATYGNEVGRATAYNGRHARAPVVADRRRR